MALVWEAAKDNSQSVAPEELRGAEVSDSYVLMRKLAIMEQLFEAATAYQGERASNWQACAHGTYNRIVSALNGSHADVRIAFDKGLLVMSLSEDTVAYAKKKLNNKPRAEQVLILSSWDEDAINPASKFRDELVSSYDAYMLESFGDLLNSTDRASVTGSFADLSRPKINVFFELAEQIQNIPNDGSSVGRNDRIQALKAQAARVWVDSSSDEHRHATLLVACAPFIQFHQEEAKKILAQLYQYSKVTPGKRSAIEALKIAAHTTIGLTDVAIAQSYSNLRHFYQLFVKLDRLIAMIQQFPLSASSGSDYKQALQALKARAVYPTEATIAVGLLQQEYTLIKKRCDVFLGKHASILFHSLQEEVEAMPDDPKNKDRSFFSMCFKKDMQELGYHNFPSVAEKYQWLELVYAFRQLDALVLELTAFFDGSAVVKDNAAVIVPWDSMRKIYTDREKSYIEKRELLMSEYKCYQLLLQTADITYKERQRRLQQICKVFLSFATCLTELSELRSSGGCDCVVIDEVSRELQDHFEKFKVSLQLGEAYLMNYFGNLKLLLAPLRKSLWKQC